MNCSNQSPENDKKVVCRSAYHKRYYAENKERILTRQKRWRTDNAEILKARRKRWYENNKERIARSQRAYNQKNKEHVSSYRRKYCKNNRERLNKYWRDYYANNKERINQRLRGKKQTEIGQNITRFGACDQGSEKVRVETSPVPSDPAVTPCGISTQS
jgi:exonuclease VII large subunit